MSKHFTITHEQLNHGVNSDASLKGSYSIEKYESDNKSFLADSFRNTFVVHDSRNHRTIYVPGYELLGYNSLADYNADKDKTNEKVLQKAQENLTKLGINKEDAEMISRHGQANMTGIIGFNSLIENEAFGQNDNNINSGIIGINIDKDGNSTLKSYVSYKHNKDPQKSINVIQEIDLEKLRKDGGYMSKGGVKYHYEVTEAASEQAQQALGKATADLLKKAQVLPQQITTTIDTAIKNNKNVSNEEIGQRVAGMFNVMVHNGADVTKMETWTKAIGKYRTSTFFSKDEMIKKVIGQQLNVPKIQKNSVNFDQFDYEISTQAIKARVTAAKMINYLSQNLNVDITKSETFKHIVENISSQQSEQWRQATAKDPIPQDLKAAAIGLQKAIKAKDASLIKGSQEQIVNLANAYFKVPQVAVELAKANLNQEKQKSIKAPKPLQHAHSQVQNNSNLSAGSASQQASDNPAPQQQGAQKPEQTRTTRSQSGDIKYVANLYQQMAQQKGASTIKFDITDAEQNAMNKIASIATEMDAKNKQEQLEAIQKDAQRKKMEAAQQTRQNATNDFSGLDPSGQVHSAQKQHQSDQQPEQQQQLSTQADISDAASNQGSQSKSHTQLTEYEQHLPAIQSQVAQHIVAVPEKKPAQKIAYTPERLCANALASVAKDIASAVDENIKDPVKYISKAFANIAQKSAYKKQVFGDQFQKPDDWKEFAEDCIHLYKEGKERQKETAQVKQKRPSIISKISNYIKDFFYEKILRKQRPIEISEDLKNTLSKIKVHSDGSTKQAEGQESSMENVLQKLKDNITTARTNRTPSNQSQSKSSRGLGGQD